ncbi:MAG: heavy metal translocating P-type ATPase [Hyphomicrobiaceae bacterium]|nr:heavy metal translocating P-type ATPase [Hyphomicrobiaceae bacterium]
MHCGGCMRKVEAALSALPDVVSARTNLSARRVTVSVHGAEPPIATLVDALRNAGFKAAELVADNRLLVQSAERDLLRRAAVAGFAAANVMLLSVSVWAADSGDMAQGMQLLFHWLSALIALPAVAYAGQPFFRSAVQALSVRRLNMDVPISLGVLLAAGMSLFQTIKGTEHVYFDAAITLLFFLLIGRFLDQRMRARAAGAAANLVALQSVTATVVAADGSFERLPARLLKPGARVLVAAGERVAVDGRVVAGDGAIDEALITGESLPRTIAIGARVYAGSVNLGGSLTIEATATDQNTLLSEIGRLMEAAEQSRGAYVRLADRAAAIYAPAVHILGLVTVLGWMVLGQPWEAALTAGIAVLIVTCPCALALAVPAVQIAASSRLFATGVLIKAPDGLERLAEIDTVVFDKTGTLTVGEPRLAHPAESETVLADAARLAASSRHPYARALVRAARDRGLDVNVRDGVAETAGAGLEWASPEGPVRLGSAVWCGVDGGADPMKPANLWYRDASGRVTGFAFEDALRPGASDVIGRLKQAGYRVEIVSGDRAEVVGEVAAALGIEAWRGGTSPADKISRLAELKAEGRKVLMVGDGLNDAPALAAAHASLSPATAADISQVTADAIFQGERLDAVVETIAVSQRARGMALQNFGIAIAYNVVFIPMAMAGIVTPLIAAIAMSASSIAVTTNAVRLRGRRLDIEQR